MTRTWILNEIDTAPSYVHEQTKEIIPSNSKIHYSAHGVRNIGRPWPARKRGNPPLTGWLIATNRRPRPFLTKEQEHQRRMRKAEEEAALADIMTDPEKRYKYERSQRIFGEVRRLRRDQRFQGMTPKQLWKYVDGYLGRADEPTIIRKPTTGDVVPTDETSAERSRRNQWSHDAAVERRAEAGNLQQKMFSKEFIDQIKEARARRTVPTEHGRRAMTQEDLGKLVHVNASVIRDFEAGKLLFDGALKSKLIWKLGLSVE